MAGTSQGPFPREALDANRAGTLTEAQRQRLRNQSRASRRTGLIAAGFLVVGAATMALGNGRSLAPPVRLLVALALLAIAALLTLRSIVGDALARDLRHVRVQSIDGAIGKRRWGHGGRAGSNAYYLDVGDRTFRVWSTQYDAAPDAGIVRVYFLPRSRKVVNLERLPGQPVPEGTTPQDLLRSFGGALLSFDRQRINEVRATAAGIGDAIEAARTRSPEPPANRDARPLAEAILGTWSNGFMTVTFSPDGNVTASVFGRQQRGRWSIDPAGRLHADVTGQQGAVDAWVTGDQLTIADEDAGLTFTRQASR